MKKQQNKPVHYRPTWAEIDLDAVKYNLDQVRKITGPDIKILAAIKANAYGHGIIELAFAFSSWGIDYLGLATVDEGIHLRKAGIKTPLLNLGSVLVTETEPLVKYNITQTVTSLEIAKSINNQVRKSSRCSRKTVYPAKVHLKIDTGMGRLGVKPHEAINIAQEIKKLKHLELEGVFTHFPVARRSDKESEEFTINQINIFNSIVEQLDDLGLEIPLCHSANSAAVIGFKSAHFNMVRPGIMLYGIWPYVDKSAELTLKRVLTLKTKITYLKTVNKGDSISYDRTYLAPKRTLIATLPIGYADGYARMYSNKTRVLVHGRRAPVVGIVCMDQIMIDVGHLDNVKIGDEVVLIGRQGKEQITAEELARLSHTNPYEVFCRISSRVPRYFLGNS